MLANRIDFGGAIAEMKNGDRVSRDGWNGNGMWIAMCDGQNDLPADKFWNIHTKAFAEKNGGFANVQRYFVMKTAQGEIQMGWNPTISDSLAEDWFIVKGEA